MQAENECAEMHGPVGTIIAAELFLTAHTLPGHEDYPELSSVGMLTVDGICSAEYKW